MKRFGIRRIVSVVAVVLVVASATPAHADYADDAVGALREKLVFVHPEAAKSLTASDASKLERLIRKGRRPIYLVVFPETALTEAGIGGGPQGLAQRISDRLGQPGTVGVVIPAGTQFGAVSKNDLDRGTLDSLVEMSTPVASRDLPEGRVSFGALLDDFVRRVQAAPKTTGSADSRLEPLPEENPLTVTLLAVGGAIVAVLVILLILYLLGRRRRRARRVQPGASVDFGGDSWDRAAAEPVPAAEGPFSLDTLRRESSRRDMEPAVEPAVAVPWVDDQIDTRRYSVTDTEEATEDGPQVESPAATAVPLPDWAQEGPPTSPPTSTPEPTAPSISDSPPTHLAEPHGTHSFSDSHGSAEGADAGFSGAD